MQIGLFTPEGLQFILRWIHFLSGVAWIGLLYYFNFVQGEWFKEVDATVKGAAIRGLVPRALWWFRWAAMLTFLTGWLIIGHRFGTGGAALLTGTSWGVFILLGGTLGTIMFLNVWLVIWPNQKIVIESAKLAAEGKAALPEAAAAAARAGLASRTNVVFSIPMLFFMGAASHLPSGMTPEYNGWLVVAFLVLILGAMQLNALKGKLGPMTSVKGAIHCGLALWAVLYFGLEVLT